MDAWIGLMSGTSMDGIDAVLVSFPDSRIQIHNTHSTPYPDAIRERLVTLSQNRGSPDELGELDHLVGALFASAATELLNTSGLPRPPGSRCGEPWTDDSSPARWHHAFLNTDR